jgi:hypothetical protein
MMMFKIQEAVTLNEIVLSKEAFEEKTKIFNKQENLEGENVEEEIVAE